MIHQTNLPTTVAEAVTTSATVHTIERISPPTEEAVQARQVLFVGKEVLDLDDEAWTHEGDPFATQPYPPHDSDNAVSSDGMSSDGSSQSELCIKIPFSLGRPSAALKWLLATSAPVRNTLDTFSKAHDKWFVRAVLLIVGFLHTKHHMSFRACSLILWSLRSIFVLLGLLASQDSMPTTLVTTFTHLGLSDRFSLLVICPSCRAVPGPPSTTFTSQTDTVCPVCKTPMYSGIAASTEPPVRYHFKTIKLKIIVPFASLKDLLTEFLSRSRMEENLEAWRLHPCPIGKYEAIWHGSLWKTILGSDGHPFFGERDDNELRIAGTCSLDW